MEDKGKEEVTKSEKFTGEEEDTIFHKILRKKIPSTAVYEDEKVYAFKDVNPQAPVHIVIIPKELDGLTGLSKAEESHIPILGHLLYIANKIAEEQKLQEGYRIVINNGKNGCIFYI